MDIASLKVGRVQGAHIVTMVVVHHVCWDARPIEGKLGNTAGSEYAGERLLQGPRRQVPEPTPRHHDRR